MPITFRQLEIFVVAAKDCNFRRTAERLKISQPSVSNHVHSLEAALGHSLFDRRRGVMPELSEEGQRFLRNAQKLVMARAGIGQPGSTLPDGMSAPLTIMAGPLLLDTCIRPRLPAFCMAHPRVVLQFVPLHPSRSAEQLVNSGDIDLAVFTGDGTDDGRVASETINTVGCSIYASPAMASRAGRQQSRLGELPWMMPPESFAPTRFMWRYLRDVNVEPRNVIVRSQFPDVSAGMALRGCGVTLLFDDFASRGLADGRLVRIGPALPSTSRLMVIGRRARHPAFEPAVRMLRQALRTSLGIQNS